MLRLNLICGFIFNRMIVLQWRIVNSVCACMKLCVYACMCVIMCVTCVRVFPRMCSLRFVSMCVSRAHVCN